MHCDFTMYVYDGKLDKNKNKSNSEGRPFVGYEINMQSCSKMKYQNARLFRLRAAASVYTVISSSAAIIITGYLVTESLKKIITRMYVEL